MQVPLQIAFRHMKPSPALEMRIRQRARELGEFFDGITACHVSVECRHPHDRQDKLFEIEIGLLVPEHEIVVGRRDGHSHAHENADVAVCNAFDALRRRLEDQVRRTKAQMQTSIAWTAGPHVQNPAAQVN